MFAFYDPEDKTTRMAVAEVAGADDFTIEDLLSRVEKCEVYTFLPILAPFLMAEGLAIQIMDYQSNNNRRKEGVERKQALYAYSDVESEAEEEEDEGQEGNDEEAKTGDGQVDQEQEETEPEEDELVGFTREFTKLYSLARSLQRSLEDNVKGLDLLQRMHDMFLESLDEEQQKVVGEAWQEVYERVVFVLTQMHQTSNLIVDTQSELRQSIQTVWLRICLTP